MDDANAHIAIRTMLAADWDAVRAIYGEGIRSGNATFETAVPEWRNWDSSHLADCRLVACHTSVVVGWAALSPVSSRAVYRGVAEVSIYVAERARERGIGSQLMCALIEASEAHGIWTLQAQMFPENAASIALCQNNDFRIVGTREKIGRLNGRWRDVAFLERRSTSRRF